MIQTISIIRFIGIFVNSSKNKFQNCEQVRYLRHVHIVDEIDQTFGAGRAVVTAGFLLQRFLEHALQHLRRGVEVEGHVGHQEILAQAVEFVLEQDGFTRTRVTHQHDRTFVLDQTVQEITDTRRLGVGYQRGLRAFERMSKFNEIISSERY